MSWVHRLFDCYPTGTLTKRRKGLGHARGICDICGKRRPLKMVMSNG
jgi:hypothetical protein